jgi:hypothetical protein
MTDVIIIYDSEGRYQEIAPPVHSGIFVHQTN